MSGLHPRRDARGATTVEYVGIGVVIIAIVGALLALTTSVSGGARNVANGVYCKLSTLVGGTAGCTANDLPANIPTTCTINKNTSSYGGGLTVVATVGGESGYELQQVKQLGADGTVQTKYVVKTKGKIGAEYKPRLGGGAEVDTGTSSVDAKEGLSFTVGADGSWGRNYTFTSQDAAQHFIDEYKDNFGEFGSTPQDAPPPDSTYYDVSAQVTGSGDIAAVDASASGAVTLGVESYANGDTRAKVALSATAAAKLGIPLPTELLKAQAKGNASLAVIADLTFDRNGDMVKVGGNVMGSVKGSASIGIDTKSLSPRPPGSNATLKDLKLPSLAGVNGGYEFNLGFSTDFRRGDGSADYSAIDALSDSLRNFVNTGQGLTDDQQRVIQDQLENHSQITFNHYKLDTHEDKYGGTLSVGPVSVGGEVHAVHTNSDLLGSYYYDTSLGSWQENTVCNR